MAAVYHIKINQGETFVKRFQWKHSNGQPVNLQGYIGRSQIRLGANNPGIVATIHVDITDAANGKFTLSLSAAETASIPARGYDYSKTEKYVYDVEFVAPSGEVFRKLNGTVEISPEVTK